MTIKIDNEYVLNAIQKALDDDKNRITILMNLISDIWLKNNWWLWYAKRHYIYLKLEEIINKNSNNIENELIDLYNNINNKLLNIIPEFIETNHFVSIDEILTYTNNSELSIIKERLDDLNRYIHTWIFEKYKKDDDYNDDDNDYFPKNYPDAKFLTKVLDDSLFSNTYEWYLNFFDWNYEIKDIVLNTLINELKSSILSIYNRYDISILKTIELNKYIKSLYTNWKIQ